MTSFGGREWRRWMPGASIVVLVAYQFAWLSPTNFHGWDEWLLLWLVSRGIVSFPYANRPLALVWNLPASLAESPVAAHFVLHGIYLALSGVLTFLIVRRLAPDRPVLAWMAGAFAAVWAPRDRLRLATVQMLAYSGFTVGLLLAIYMLVEWWGRRRWWLLVGACAMAVVTVRGYEGALPLLLGAPLLMAPLAPRRAGWSWVPGWYGALGVAAMQIIVPPGAAPASLEYQLRLGVDLDPVGLAGRMLQHYGSGLLPLVQTPGHELARGAVLPAVVLFGVALADLVRHTEAPFRDRRAYALAMGLGLALASLGWAAFAASPALTTPDRTQMLPAPGLGLFLAGAALWLGSWFPERWRLVAVMALGGWVVWVATARVLAMQSRWDTRSTFAAQRRLLRELTRLAPDLRPHTLVVLLDRTGAWGPIDFPFAVEYIYAGNASGYLWGSKTFLYTTELTPAGAIRRPHPSVVRPWRWPPTLHRYDEVVFVRYAADGTVTLFNEWPGRILPQPAGALYAPESRILQGRVEPPSRAVLR